MRGCRAGVEGRVIGGVAVVVPGENGVLLRKAVETFEAILKPGAHERVDCETVLIMVLGLNGFAGAVVGVALLVDLRDRIHGRCGQEHVVSPGPPEELAELLENEEVQDSAGADFFVVVTGDSVPVEAGDGHGEREDEGDGEGVGVAEHTLHGLAFGF